MWRDTWREALWVCMGLVVLTLIIGWTGADLAVSSRFYINGGWPIGEQFPWKLLYRIDRTPAVLLALVGWLGAAASWKWPSRRHWAKSGAFLVLFLALGPGLLVNTVFKDGWGRPRPREVVQFNGPKQFLHPWQKGITGKGRSFPSGHAAAAFYLCAPFFIYRRSRPTLARRWLIGGICFGILMSYARISQGGHFLSDNLWSFGMVYLTGLFLAAALKLNGPPVAPDEPEPVATD